LILKTVKKLCDCVLVHSNFVTEKAQNIDRTIVDLKFGLCSHSLRRVNDGYFRRWGSYPVILLKKSTLFSITKSKSATAINLIKFIPFVGDFVPVYTLSTVYRISKELKRPKLASTYFAGPQLYYPYLKVLQSSTIN